MFQVIAFNNELKNYCVEKGILPLAQNRLADLYMNELQVYAQCVFQFYCIIFIIKSLMHLMECDHYQKYGQRSVQLFLCIL